MLGNKNTLSLFNPPNHHYHLPSAVPFPKIQHSLNTVYSEQCLWHSSLRFLQSRWQRHQAHGRDGLPPPLEWCPPKLSTTHFQSHSTDSNPTTCLKCFHMSMLSTSPGKGLLQNSGILLHTKMHIMTKNPCVSQLWRVFFWQSSSQSSRERCL